MCVHTCKRPGEGKSDSLELELELVVSCLMWELGTKQRFSGEQQVLLTTQPSLQPLPVMFMPETNQCVLILL